MTNQEYYNLLIEKTNSGMLPALSEDTGSCVYWNKETDKKCAVGLLIPKNKYRKTFEGLCYEDLPSEIITSIIPSGLVRYDLERIQSIHDRNARLLRFKTIFVQELNKLKCFQDVKKVEA